jgi:hypothetical protein
MSENNEVFSCTVKREGKSKRGIFANKVFRNHIEFLRKNQPKKILSNLDTNFFALESTFNVLSCVLEKITAHCDVEQTQSIFNMTINNLQDFMVMLTQAKMNEKK